MSKQKEEAYTETCMSTKNKNDHIYKNGHKRGQKWVPRHDSGGIRKEI